MDTVVVLYQKRQTGIDAMVTKLCETYENVKLVIQSSGTEPVAADKITSVLEQLIEQVCETIFN
jgi:hypothetical protein